MYNLMISFVNVEIIGKYYAVEDMLTTNPVEKFGQVTLKQVRTSFQLIFLCIILTSSLLMQFSVYACFLHSW